VTLVASRQRSLVRKYPGLAMATPGLLLMVFWAAVPDAVRPPRWVAALCIILWVIMLGGIALQGFLFRREILLRRTAAQANSSRQPWE
jgi:hypothetical protein